MCRKEQVLFSTSLNLKTCRKSSFQHVLRLRALSIVWIDLNEVTSLLLPDVIILFYRIRDSMLLQYFSEEDDVMCYNNILFFLNEMDIENFSPLNWRLFTENSKLSLNCVLLPNGNESGSIFVGA